MDNTTRFLYGFEDAATDFDRRHPLWRDVLQRLAHTINLAFTRTQTMNTIEKFVYFYGRLVAEDFMEIFLVAVNGYGVAAMKLLRSMYEHAVTLQYIHEHPDEGDKFIDYDAIQQFKLMQPTLETFGRNILSTDTVADVRRKYEEAKERFKVKACDCGAERVNHTWNKLDFVAMAKKTGDLGSMIVHAYYLPLRHSHSTYRAIIERLEKRDGRLGFQVESEPKLADDALMVAHNCLLVALEVQKQRFTIEGLEAEIQRCVVDWAKTWSPNSALANSANTQSSEIQRTVE